MNHDTAQQVTSRANSYGAGHPWYYLLGGSVQGPKQILYCVKASGYQGYMADAIHEADSKPEPQRSQVLRSIRAQVKDDFRRDLSRYRALACELHTYRQHNGLVSEQPVCADIHTNISLKYCHIYNDLAHVLLLDDLLSRQPDLFDF